MGPAAGIASVRGVKQVPISENLHNDIEEIPISEPVLQARIDALAAVITEDYRRQNLLLLGILKGAVMFMADLSRRLSIPHEMDFMAISSYGNTTESSGVVRI